jgi:hypothetical protein
MSLIQVNEANSSATGSALTAGGRGTHPGLYPHGRYSVWYGKSQFPQFESDLLKSCTDGGLANTFGRPDRVLGQSNEIRIANTDRLHGTPLRSGILLHQPD